MFALHRLSYLIAATLALVVASTSLADDVFIKEGVVVKPLSKRKQRKLEKKMIKRPGSEVVIEGTPTVTPSPEALAGMKSRRAFRPLFPDRFGKRSEVVIAPSVVTTPSTVITGPGPIVSSPRSQVAPGDPQVMPGSAEMMPTLRSGRAPVLSIPKAPDRPAEPDDGPELEVERPASARILPPPADEIPPPVVSIPRKPAGPAPMPIPATPPAPAPAPAPESSAPSVDPGPASPPPAPAPEPTLERPLDPKPA